MVPIQVGPAVSIASRYEAACHSPSDISEHLPTFVQLVRDTDARVVIELGVRNAVSTLGWLTGLAETGGHLWSVDSIPHSAEFDDPGWTFLQGDDRWPDILNALPATADIVFVDTSHEYEHTCQEIKLYAPRVRPGGCMVFHDTEVAEFGVRRAVDEWVESDGFVAEFHDNCYGLGIVWMPDA